MRMKVWNNIVLFLLSLHMGCSGMSDGDEKASVVPPDSFVQSVDRPRRIPPRISRWLAKSKVEFRQAEDRSGVYRLTLESPEPMSADQRVYVQEYFRSRAAESFAKSNAIDSSRVVVALLSEGMETNRYRAVATACGADDIALSYNPDTRRGVLAMKIRDGDFNGTRELIRRHIEAIVRDKNIRLVAGVPPPPGRYYLLGENVKPGNVLEIEFKSE